MECPAQVSVVEMERAETEHMSCTWKSSSHSDSRGEVVSDGSEGSLGIPVNTEYNSKGRQATRPERLAEPDLGRLVYVFQILYTHLHKTRKEVVLVAAGLRDQFSTLFTFPSSS